MTTRGRSGRLLALLLLLLLLRATTRLWAVGKLAQIGARRAIRRGVGAARKRRAISDGVTSSCLAPAQPSSRFYLRSFYLRSAIEGKDRSVLRFLTLLDVLDLFTVRVRARTDQ